MPKDNKTFPRFFLALLGFIALLIIVQNSIFFIQKRDSFKLFSRESIELEGRKLEREIERQSELSAAQCLNNQNLLELADQLKENEQGAVAFGLKAREIADKTPIAESFFLLIDGNLRFPPLKTEKPYSPLDSINSSSSSEEKEFATLFRKAEKESKQGKYESAIDVLEECSMLPLADSLKSRALDLQARVYLADKNPTNAVRIWNRLEDKFPDSLNEFYVPYALAAAIEIDELDAGRNTDRKETLKSLYKDLLNGRWPLSEEVVLKLKDRLEKRLGYATPAVDNPPYLREFQLARLVDTALGKKKDIAGGEDIHSRAIKDGQENIQLYYRVLDKENPRRILAMSVNTAWARTALLNQSWKALNSQVTTISKFIIEPADAPGETDLAIPFDSAYSFWELRLPKGAIATSQLIYKVQLGTIAMIAIVTLVLLIIIMLLILRITREKMAVQIKSDFLGHVSHELKTPLTLIQLYTETLMTDESLDEADRRYSLQVISRESSHLLNLIENLLYLSSTEKAPEQFQLTEGDIGQVIEKTAGVYSEWLHKQGITLKTNIAPALPLVRFDREKVTRAFLNLVDNARKYGGDSASIEVGIWSEDNKVLLEVRDHGPGIAEAERKLIFDQFYRGSDASESRGVGLGLYLVNETMKAHNGSVELETELGKGSAFRLAFPALARN